MTSLKSRLGCNYNCVSRRYKICSFGVPLSFRHLRQSSLRFRPLVHWPPPPGGKQHLVTVACLDKLRHLNLSKGPPVRYFMKSLEYHTHFALYKFHISPIMSIPRPKHHTDITNHQLQ